VKTDWRGNLHTECVNFLSEQDSQKAKPCLNPVLLFLQARFKTDTDVEIEYKKGQGRGERRGDNPAL
jgi:hypothetical protein